MRSLPALALLAMGLSACGDTAPQPDLSIVNPDGGKFCKTNADCAGEAMAKACYKGLCVVCAVDTDCPSGTKCDNQKACVECIAVTDCGAGKVCISSKCMVGCKAEAPCPAGQVCDLTVGACVTCLSDKDCKDPKPHCDVAKRDCVGCTKDDECGTGKVCRESACADGCSAPHPLCPTGQVCNINAGVCVGCVVDSDCKDATRSRCETRMMTCVECLSAPDNCASGTYCAETSCVPGCKSSADCAGMVGATQCDLTSHTCVECVDDLPCAAGKVCQANKCAAGCNAQHACPGGQGCCEGTCIALSSDVMNCGSCGNVCAAVPNGTPGCAGACGIGACNTGYRDCNASAADGCETKVSDDVMNCGVCGKTCAYVHGTAGCQDGACKLASCNDGWGDCDNDPVNGCETSLLTLTDCGACGVPCSVSQGTPTCATGVCKSSKCNPGFEDCNGDTSDGCEINLTNDLSNCGTCKKACAAVANSTRACKTSVCTLTCAANYDDCDKKYDTGCEVALLTDVKNCAKCGTVCPAIANGQSTCAAGVCGLKCSTGYEDCDKTLSTGCEINLTNDIKNCGTCKKICPAVTNGTIGCLSGVCGVGSCNTGWDNCDKNAANGCEINLLTDAANCGKCGNKCGVGALYCVNGSCVANPVSCKMLKAYSPSLATGRYPIDPDGTGPVGVSTVYCDMATAGGGWTLLAWTQDSYVYKPVGVPYPALAYCSTHACTRGSGVPAASLEALFAVSSELAVGAKTATPRIGVNPLSSYTYAGRYAYPSLKGLKPASTSAVGCSTFATGTYYNIQNTTTVATTVYVPQYLSPATNTYTDASVYTFTAGVRGSCTGVSYPATSWGSSPSNGYQYGPATNAAGSYSFWVR